MSNKSKNHGNKPHPDPHQNSAQENERKIRGDIHVHGEVEANLPPDLVKQHKAERNEDAAHAQKNYIVQVVTLGVLILYASFTFWQGWLTREAIDKNTQQFQIDQRPYIWTSNVMPKTSIIAGEKMWANIHLINYGKSPALRAIIAGWIFTGPNAKTEAERWFMALGDKALYDPNTSGIVIPPGIPPPLPEDFSKTMFGGGGFFTLLSHGTLAQPDVDYILNNDESAVIAFRLQYFDGFGGRYWSDVCLTRLKNGNMFQCPQDNGMR